MNDDERRLADFLHQATPQPLHGLDADELMSGRPRSRGFHYWPQLAAAAAVVLVAGGTAAAVNFTGDNGPGPAAAPSSTPASPSPTISDTPVRTVAPSSSAVTSDVPVKTVTPTTPGSTDEPSVAPTSAKAPQRDPSTTPPRHVAACTLAHLAITVEQRGNGTAGHNGRDIYYRNTGSSPCTMHGFPFQVIAAKSSGSDVRSVATPTRSGYQGGLPSGAPMPTVRLKPGQQAFQRVEYTEEDGKPTHVYRTIEITDATRVVDRTTSQMLVELDPSARGGSSLEIDPVQAYPR